MSSRKSALRVGSILLLLMVGLVVGVTTLSQASDRPEPPPVDTSTPTITAPADTPTPEIASPVSRITIVPTKEFPAIATSTPAPADDAQPSEALLPATESPSPTPAATSAPGDTSLDTPISPDTATPAATSAPGGTSLDTPTPPDTAMPAPTATPAPDSPPGDTPTPPPTLTPSLPSGDTPTPHLTLTPSLSPGDTPMPSPPLSDAPTSIPTSIPSLPPNNTPGATATPSLAAPGRIVGQVLLDGAPVDEDVMLMLEDQDYNVVAETTVEADGIYVFEGLAPSSEGYNVLFAQEWNTEYGIDQVISWGWLGPLVVKSGAVVKAPAMDISLQGFKPVSPVAHAVFAAAALSPEEPLTFEWAAYPDAATYWVDLAQGAGQEVVWQSPFIQGMSVAFDGTLEGGTHVQPGEYWWGVGARRALGSYTLTVYGYLLGLTFEP